MNIVLLFLAFDNPDKEFSSNFADKMMEKPIISENFPNIGFSSFWKK